MNTIALHAAEAGTELPVPAWVYGASTLAVLLLMLIMVFVFGRGRPHA